MLLVSPARELHQKYIAGRGSLMGLIPTVTHSAIVFVLNNLYSRVAEFLTERENHRSEQAHMNSLILKRFTFEFFDAFLILFYLAFVHLDMEALRRELVALFSSDCARRVGTELILVGGFVFRSYIC